VLVAAAGCLALPSAALVASGASTVPPTGEPVEFGAWSGVRFRILIDPDWLAADEDHVYIQSVEHVSALDPESGAITTAVEVASDHCQGIGAGLGGVWTCSGSDVIPIDQHNGTTGTPIPINKSAEQGHLPTGFDRLWVLTDGGSTLVGLEPETGDVTGEVTLDARCLDVAVDQASVWLACALDDVVLRIDPASLEVVDRIDVMEPRGVAFSEGAVWVGGVGAVVRLDPETLGIVASQHGECGVGVDWHHRADRPRGHPRYG